VLFIHFDIGHWPMDNNYDNTFIDIGTYHTILY